MPKLTQKYFTKEDYKLFKSMLADDGIALLPPTTELFDLWKKFAVICRYFGKTSKLVKILVTPSILLLYVLRSKNSLEPLVRRDLGNVFRYWFIYKQEEEVLMNYEEALPTARDKGFLLSSYSDKLRVLNINRVLNSEKNVFVFNEKHPLLDKVSISDKIVKSYLNTKIEKDDYETKFKTENPELKNALKEFFKITTTKYLPIPKSEKVLNPFFIFIKKLGYNFNKRSWKFIRYPFRALILTILAIERKRQNRWITVDEISSIIDLRFYRISKGGYIMISKRGLDQQRRFLTGILDNCKWLAKDGIVLKKGSLSKLKTSTESFKINAKHTFFTGIEINKLDRENLKAIKSYTE